MSLAESTEVRARDKTLIVTAAEGLSAADVSGCRGNKYFLLGFFPVFHATELNLQLSIHTAHIRYETLLLCFILVLIYNFAQCLRCILLPAPHCHEDNVLPSMQSLVEKV